MTTTHPAGDTAGEPLSPAYCAERAADAIRRAEQATGGDVEETCRLLDCADAWRDLGVAMSHNPSMIRPRDDDRARR
jgi:hypothetical protein